MTQPIVHIVDDDPAVRDALQLLLDVRGFATRVHADAAAFLRALDPAAPGCALIDLRMPRMTGGELQAELERRGIALPIVIITAHGDVAATRAAFKGGALDFLEKPVDPAALVAAVEGAIAHDAALRERSARAGEASRRFVSLTTREREVVERIVAGRHNREIAIELGISPRTVEVYKARAMEKLDVRRLPDLVRLAMRARGEVK